MWSLIEPWWPYLHIAPKSKANSYNEKEKAGKKLVKTIIFPQAPSTRLST
jgi:hypothetical protein